MDGGPTERETQILKVLWDGGEMPVRAVHEALAGVSGLHFDTVQTQLRIMDEKKLVAHRREGRSFLYRALCSREDLAGRFLHRVFDGAVGDLVLSMSRAESMTADELRELEKLVAAARRKATKAAGKPTQRTPKGGDR